MNTSKNAKRLLPVGIQSFEKLRDFNAVYVDKTEYIYKLVHEVTPFFLSRPRRFGKSLLLSTLCAYWEGKKELFKGLAIEQLEAENAEAWKSYPVFYFDFNGRNYKEENAIEKALNAHLSRWEAQFGCPSTDKSLEDRFADLLINAHKFQWVLAYERRQVLFKLRKEYRTSHVLRSCGAEIIN